MKDTVEKYLKTKSIYPHYTENSSVSTEFSEKCLPIAVCIPAYNEYPTLFSTLQSLALSSATCSVKVQAIICINNKKNTSIEVKQNNELLINTLRKIQKNEISIINDEVCGVKITVLDYTDSKNNFSDKQGVGYARKIAMDYALAYGAKVIACLDADTLVSVDYCGELNRFLTEKLDFATMDFVHQDAPNSFLQEIICHYEFWMKDHSKQMKMCGTPFHYMALGSLIVVSREMYAQIGGMKDRLAGEDFYFIQEAIKILLSRIKVFSDEAILNPVPLLSSCVYPQARVSDRVLFGTGKTMAQVDSGSKMIRFYQESSYNIVKQFIDCFNELNYKGHALDFMEKAFSINKKLSDFLVEDRFFNNWDLIIKNTKNDKLKNAISFHCKFDGLKIIRVIHWLER